MHNTKEKLSFKTKLIYGIGGIADEAMYTLAGTYLLFFLTSVADIKPMAAGAIVAAGSIWEVICGPITGFISDNTETRFGKRKPFLISAAFPVAIITCCLFTTLHVAYPIKLLYYFVITLMFWQSFALYFVPYLAWGSELTEDYDERTVLRSYAYIFNQVGMTIGMVLPTAMVDLILNLGKSKELAWALTGIIVGVTSALALLICGIGIKDTDVKNFVKKKKTKKKGTIIGKIKTMFWDYGDIVKLRPVKYIMGASLLYLISNTLFSSARIYFFTYNLGISAGEISIILLVITIAGICFAPAIAKISGITDKKKIATIGIGASGILMIAGRFIGITSFFGGCMLCVCYALGNTSYWQLMPSMLYDVCEADELASGEKRSGQVISLQAMSESLSCAFGAQLLGGILQLAGFQNGTDMQGEKALFWISNSFTLIPGICMLAVAIIIYKHPIDKKAFRRILEALEKKKRNEIVDISEFDDIYGKGRK